MKAQVLSIASGEVIAEGKGTLWTLEATAGFMFSLFNETPAEREAIMCAMMRAGTLTGHEATLLDYYIREMRGECDADSA